MLCTPKFMLETWNLKNKQHLVSLINKHKKNGIILLSGDIHFAEFIKLSKKEGLTYYDLHEITSSGLTHVCLS